MEDALLNAADESAREKVYVDDALAADVVGTPCASEDVALEPLSEVLESELGMLLARELGTGFAEADPETTEERGRSAELLECSAIELAEGLCASADREELGISR